MYCHHNGGSCTSLTPGYTPFLPSLPFRQSCAMGQQWSGIRIICCNTMQRGPDGMVYGIVWCGLQRNIMGFTIYTSSVLFLEYCLLACQTVIVEDRISMLRNEILGAWVGIKARMTKIQNPYNLKTAEPIMKKFLQGLCSMNCPSWMFPWLTTYGRRAFSLAGPMFWNSVPRNLRDQSYTAAVFGRSLKTFIFSEY